MEIDDKGEVQIGGFAKNGYPEEIAEAVADKPVSKDLWVRDGNPETFYGLRFVFIDSATLKRYAVYKAVAGYKDFYFGDCGTYIGSPDSETREFRRKMLEKILSHQRLLFNDGIEEYRP